jgi:hypothetical protein
MSEHGGTSLSQLTIDSKVIALYSTLSQLLLDKYEQLALTDKSRTAAESAACIEATVQAVKAARAREREKHLKDEQLKKQVRYSTRILLLHCYTYVKQLHYLQYTAILGAECILTMADSTQKKLCWYIGCIIISIGCNIVLRYMKIAPCVYMQKTHGSCYIHIVCTTYLFVLIVIIRVLHVVSLISIGKTEVSTS